MVYKILPSTILSSTPVIVTVWGVFHVEEVNVSDVGETVPSFVFELVRLIVTLAVGWVFRTMVNVDVPPDSVVISPDVGVTVMPGMSN